MSGMLTILVIIESLLTAVGVTLYVYRKRLDFQENDTLILDSAEEHLVAGQAQIRARVNSVESILKYVAIGWLVFGLAALALYVAEGAGLV
jgi:cell division protein FtsL